jgi:hypothetical protein
MVPQTTVRIIKSIAGALLAGLGMFILYAKLSGAVEHWHHILANGSAAMGGLPAAILVLVQTVHDYGFEHHRFVHNLFQQALVSSLWPLFLVIFGTVLSKDTFVEDSQSDREHQSDAIDSSSRGTRNSR